MEPPLILQRLGFNDKEVAIYLAAQNVGMAPTSVIANRANLKRPTTHEILQRLCTRGVAKRFVRNNVRYYTMVSPDDLCQKLTDDIEQLRSVIPQIRPQHSKTHTTSCMSFFEGRAELQSLYLDVLGAKSEVLHYTLPNAACKYFGMAWMRRRIVPARRRLKQSIRTIVPWQDGSDLCCCDAPYQEVRIINDDSYSFSDEVFLYDDNMAVFSFDEDVALLLHSPHISHTQRVLFELAWESGKVGDC